MVKYNALRSPMVRSTVARPYGRPNVNVYHGVDDGALRPHQRPLPYFVRPGSLNWTPLQLSTWGTYHLTAAQSTHESLSTAFRHRGRPSSLWRGAAAGEAPFSNIQLKCSRHILGSPHEHIRHCENSAVDIIRLVMIIHSHLGASVSPVHR